MFGRQAARARPDQNETASLAPIGCIICTGIRPTQDHTAGLMYRIGQGRRIRERPLAFPQSFDRMHIPLGEVAMLRLPRCSE